MPTNTPRRARSLDRHLVKGGPYPLDPDRYREHRAAMIPHRVGVGFDPVPAPLLTPPNGNAKLAKGAVPAYGLSLSPANSSGLWNACPASTPGCRKGCLGTTAGHNVRSSALRGKVWRTRFLAADPVAFLSVLAVEVDRAVKRHGAITLRLNVYSDLRWELIAPDLFTRWGDRVQFYDYTKVTGRSVPDRYRLAYSYSDRDARRGLTPADVLDREGVPVSVVVGPRADDRRVMLAAAKRALVPAVDADASDEWLIDGDPVLGILTAKGPIMSADRSGMVVRDSGQLV